MKVFLKSTKKDFVCTRMGASCVADPDETLEGKVVLIGHQHNDAHSISNIRSVIKENLRRMTAYSRK